MRAPVVRLCGTVLALAALAGATASASAQTPKQRAVLKGLSYAVDTLAISPDGKLLAAGGWYGHDGELKLWDLTTGKERTNFKGSNQFPHVAFAPDGKTLASCGKVKEGEEFKDLVTFYDPDGKTLAAAVPFAEKIVLWDLVTGKEKATLKTEVRPNRVAFTPDGNTLAAGMSDGTIILWEFPAK